MLTINISNTIIFKLSSNYGEETMGIRKMNVDMSSFLWRDWTNMYTITRQTLSFIYIIPRGKILFIYGYVANYSKI